MIVTIYDQATGAVRRVLDVPPQEVALNFDPDTEAVYVGEVNPEDTYFSEGQPVAMPPCPGKWAIWNGSEWIDPRSPEDIVVEVSTALAAKRAATSLTKLGFILSAINAGIITVEEGKQAARLEIPASFESVIASLPQEQRDYVRIMWAGAQNIYRMDPFILSVANLKGITEEQLDALFGVTS